MGDDKRSIITSAVADPANIDVGAPGRPARTHSGEWVIPPTEGLRELPRSKREVLECIYAEQREYFARHVEGVEAIRRAPDYLAYVARLSDRARVVAVTDGHWARGNPTRYVELLSASYIWASLVE